MVHRFLTLLSLGLSLMFLSPELVFAKTPVQATSVIQPSPTPQISGEVLGTVTKKVDYVLPYPGISLDHPLYVLKQLRDMILEKLISDPIRKAEFYMLQADKFVNMAVFAIDQGKTKIVGKAVTQGEWYLQQSEIKLITLKNNGISIPGSVTDRLEKSVAKHIEVLTELLTNVSASEKEVITDALTLAKKLQADLSKLK
ncbi:hypothetical protein HYV22_02575 [Candidatus Gottesmanbacteria bacterium]|nr:hypothetical protein [Candidatus Gottesmanbacteria bacterium]